MPYQQKILEHFRAALPETTDLTEGQVRILLNHLGIELSEERLRKLMAAASDESGKVTCERFISWMFGCDEKAKAEVEKGQVQQPTKSHAPEPKPEAKGVSEANRSVHMVETSVQAQLRQILEQHPYAEPGGAASRHPAQPFVENCLKCLELGKYEQAQEELRRTRSVIETDIQQITEAFRRFDKDGSGFLEAAECRHMCAYLGWGSEEWSLMDKDKDSKISLLEFQTFVGKMGGIRQLFEQRRLRISTSRKDVCDYMGIAEGARVRAHYYVQGQKSRGWREAQVLKVGVHMHFGKADMGPGTFGVLLQFGFGTDSTRKWVARQVVPPTWILSGVEDASVASALRESGILDEQQAFWGLLLPETEMQAIARLESCQRQALYTVRAQATKLHDEALPRLRERFQKLGYGDEMLGTVLDWIQDLAPVVVHVHLDRVGAFLEVDEFYRNQFETKTSCGALDPENRTRHNWENALFGHAYNEAKPFDRPKYGALSVMNDYRGVISARQYGDSYLVLKDVRLRCTFAGTDSGGISSSRLAVLDKYAHVLSEYNENELHGVILVASNAKAGSAKGTIRPELLKGQTEDPTMDWVTMGYPQLAQASGKYYFEVNLIEGAEAPQVGLLSKDFKPQPGVASTQGVGDCENGWAVDGQNSIRWHRGEPLPWGQTWPSTENTRKLSQMVTVGVAVDLDNRCIYFSTDGKWEEKWLENPAFSKDRIPAGVEVFPAISLKGRASFDFGPYWKYKPPIRKGHKTNFNVWRHASPGVHRVDVPQIGNSEMLSIYKEVQLHGELSLKRNVQRLVAARKYRDMNKMQRSFGLRVSKAGECGGSYKRVGARCDMPMYRCGNGSVLYYDGLSNHWRMALKTGSEEEQFADKAVYCSVPAVLNATEPPRSGWKLPDEERGLLPKAIFMKGLDAKGVSPEVIQSLVLKMVHQDSEGKVSAFRRKGGVSFDAEWAKLEDPPCEAQAAWQSCVDQLQENLMNEFGVPGSHVVESAHPYEAKGFRWTKEVCIKGAAALMVNFYEKSCTYDSNTRLCIFSGGLPRDAAGPGARVELHTCCSQRVWGTVAERVEGNWKVLLDRQPPGTTSAPAEEWPRVGDQAQAKYLYGMWYACKIAAIKEEGGVKIYTVEWDDGDYRDKEKIRDEIQPRGGGPVPELAAARNVEDVEIYRDAAPKDGTVQCFAYCKEDPPKRVLVKYSKQEGPKYDEQGFDVTCGDELLVFSLDRTCPLTPIVLSKIADKPGPAKAQGVESGWYLDLVKTFSGPHREALGELLNGRLGGLTLDLCPVKPDQVMQAVMSNLDSFVQLLNTKVRAMDDVTLCFINSSAAVVPVLLPEVQVQYDAPVGSEIEILGHDGKTDVVVKSFTKEGPAQAAGVRPGWAVDWQKTRQLNPSVELPTKEELMDTPKVLLEKSGLRLAFKNLYPVKTRRCLYFGNKSTTATGAWRSLEIPGEYCEFEFSSDGDGSSFPHQRWGFWALVSAKPKDVEESKADNFTIEVEKTKDRLLGISTEEVNGACVISSIEPGSTPIQEWNAAHPDKALKVNDTILEVNGVKTSHKHIVDELRKFQKHVIVAKRAKQPMCTKGHLLGPDARAHHTCDVCRTRSTHYRCQGGCDYDMCMSCFQAFTSGPVHCPVEDLTSFAQNRVQLIARAEGNQDDPEVERDSWDEQRLRALCAKHGWDFEWMTEDGERRRRANERFTEWKLEESMASFLHEDTSMPDSQALKPEEVEEEVVAPPVLQRVNS